MYGLEISKDAAGDLERLQREDEEAYYDVVAFLQEVQASQQMLDALTDDGYSDGAVSDVCPILRLQRQRLNFWRCKLYGLDPADSGIAYRIIYAFDRIKKIIVILAIAKRKEIGNYDHNSPIIQRCIGTYRQLGIPESF